MKRPGSIAAFAFLAATTAYAQTQYEPAVPRGIPDSSAVQPSRELAQPAPAAAQVVEPVVPKLVMDRPRVGTDADARQCLQLASNQQIHRCAQRYLPAGARRGRVTRTKAAKPEAAIAAPSRSRAADLSKPDLSKAAEPAKAVDMTKAAPAPAPTPSAAIQKPAAGPQPAAPAPVAEKSADRPPKWTDSAKDVMKSRGDRLPQ